MFQLLRRGRARHTVSSLVTGPPVTLPTPTPPCPLSAQQGPPPSRRQRYLVHSLAGQCNPLTVPHRCPHSIERSHPTTLLHHSPPFIISTNLTDHPPPFRIPAPLRAPAPSTDSGLGSTHLQPSEGGVPIPTTGRPSVQDTVSPNRRRLRPRRAPHHHTARVGTGLASSIHLPARRHHRGRNS